MATATPQRKVVRAQGTLRRERVRRGTASEHESLVLEGAKQRWVLTPLAGNPFELPQEALAWIGRRVRVEGYVLDGELRYLKLQPA